MPDDDDVPPLEDMSELFQKSLKLKPNVQKVIVNEYLEPTESIEDLKVSSVKKLLTTENSSKNDKDLNRETKEKSRGKTNEQSSNFCGFKKGFLFQDSRKTNTSITSKQRNDLPVVKKNELKDQNIIPEVQDSMKQQIPMLQSNEWVTEELLAKVLSHPKLSKHFTDPKFSEAISLFQTDPQKVMSMCQQNAELREFIQEFSSLMGDHFLKMADSKEKAEVNRSENPSDQHHREETASPEDQEKMQTILSDPEIVTIMKSPDIQKLFRLIKTKPDEVSSMLKSADGALRHKIQRLVDVGLLQFSSG